VPLTGTRIAVLTLPSNGLTLPRNTLVACALLTLLRVPLLVTDQKTMKVELEMPLLLICEKKISGYVPQYMSCTKWSLF
jgi:hypothetical protein